ncbi:MAG: bifunctional riboflavin kinase/FAD synthetase [Chloroflexi bacterium]|nr:bifunctional riboflavin kinase/FAD synthetase [Chloroflexota bacterium]
MIHVHSLEGVTLDRSSYVTIGAFDGVHLGHQRLIGEMARAAHAAGCAAVVVTFYPHPSVVLRGRRPSFYINSPDEKAELLGALGVDWVVTHPFTLEISKITAADFVDRLLTHLKMVELWTGEDFALGHNREGNVPYLRGQGEARGFRVRVVEPRALDTAIISSSGVRAALQSGDVALAAKFLGRPFSVSGRVVAGAKRGRVIGIPTANLEVSEDRACPANGIYACRARIGDETWMAASSIGVRPTFEQNGAPTVEAHLLDFSGDLYDRTLTLDFVARLRPEEKFATVEALVDQIHADIRQTRQLLKSVIPDL